MILALDCWSVSGSIGSQGQRALSKVPPGKGFFLAGVLRPLRFSAMGRAKLLHLLSPFFLFALWQIHSEAQTTGVKAIC